MQSFESIPVTSRITRNSAIFAFLFVIFMTGLVGALRTPALTVFLHNEVTSDPLKVGVFYAVNSLMAMVLSQIVAYFSDKNPNRKQIIMASCMVQIAGCLLFAFNRDYYVLLLAGTFLVGLGSAVTPQVFALAREYNDTQKRDSTMFSTVLRAQLSLAWVVGPPLAYYLSAELGFTFIYSVSAAIFAISIIIIAVMLPIVKNNKRVSPSIEDEALREEGISSNCKSVILLFIASLLLLTCNSMMFINMPIYITQIGLPEQLAGVMMGTAAGIEIPIMLFAGYCTRFISKKVMLIISVIAAFLYYLGLSIATEIWHFIAIQLFNGIFIGIFASIGMLYFQDLMPYQMGTATTLFNNSGVAAWILGGPSAGIMAKYIDYHSTWSLALILIVISLFFLLPIRKL